MMSEPRVMQRGHCVPKGAPVPQWALLWEWSALPISGMGKGMVKGICSLR